MGRSAMQLTGRFLLVIFCLNLSIICTQEKSTAQTVNNSSLLKSNIVAVSAAYAELFTSITWPQKDAGIGFKGIYIGDVWPLDDKRIVIVHDQKFNVYPNSLSPPFDCENGLFIECHLQLWDANSYPSNIMDLKTAFGDKIVLLVSFLPEKISLLLEPGRDQFGSGRVADITIENRSPSHSFVSNAVDFLSRKLGYPPAVRKNDKEPSVRYSPSCASRMAIIGKKPIVALTPDDLTVSKECESEYISALIAGSASGTTIKYVWRNHGSLVKATVVSTLDGNGESSYAYVSLNVDAADQLAKFSSRVAALKEKQDTNTKDKLRKDF